MVVKTLLTMTLVGVAGLEATPQPRVVGVDTIGGPGLELPEVIVPAGSKHYIMYKKPGQDGWPTLWINLYDNNGQLWSKHYETPSSPGHGFQRVLSTAVDYLGNLYFSYEHNVPGMISRTVKLGVDGNKVWEIDHTYSTIMPMPGAKDVLTSGVGTARLAQDSGARLWSTPLGGVAVSDNYSSVFAVAAYKDLKVGKVDQLGALKYERTFNYPQHTTSEVKGVFVSEDQGFLAVVLRYHSSQPETIVVHRFDSQGYLLGTHEIETGLQLAKHTPIQVVHTRNDWVTIAWDNRHHDGGPGGRWKVVRVAFSPSQEAQPSDPRKFRLRQPWVGETKFSKTLLRGYSYLADMTVSETRSFLLVPTREIRIMYESPCFRGLKMVRPRRWRIAVPTGTPVRLVCTALVSRSMSWPKMMRSPARPGAATPMSCGSRSHWHPSPPSSSSPRRRPRCPNPRSFRGAERSRYTGVRAQARKPAATRRSTEVAFGALGSDRCPRCKPVFVAGVFAPVAGHIVLKKLAATSFMAARYRQGVWQGAPGAPASPVVW